MISAYIKTKNGKELKLGEGVWCIAGLGNYYNQGSFYDINFDLETYNLTIDSVSEYIMDMETWGLPMQFLQKNDEIYTVSFDLDLYNSYTKLVTILTLFRIVFNKYASEHIFKNYLMLTPIFPQLDSLQIYQLAFYKAQNRIDGLHSIVPSPKKLTTIDKFKERFSKVIRLHAMFDEQDMVHPNNLLKEPEKNKEKILKLVLC